MAYQEPKKRSIRLDDDVYEAVRKMPMSLNQFLRKALSADGAFELSRNELRTMEPRSAGRVVGLESAPPQRTMREKGDKVK